MKTAEDRTRFHLKHSRFTALIASVALVAGLLALSTAVAAQTTNDTNVEDRHLPYMALPVADLGEKFAGFQVDASFSGFEPADDRDPNEVAAYALFYTPTSFGSPEEAYPATFVVLYTDAEAASSAMAELRAEIDGAGELETVATFDVPDLGDEAIGVAFSASFDDFSYSDTVVVFRTGRLIGASLIERYDAIDAQDQTVAIARALAARIKGVESGEITGLPGMLPPDLNCDGTVNSIDATLVLQLSASLVEVDAIRCGFLGDANGDGSANAIDATLIMQFDAELIWSFTEDAPRLSGADQSSRNPDLACKSLPGAALLAGGKDDCATLKVRGSASPEVSPAPIAPSTSAVLAVDCDVAMDGVQSTCSYPSGAKFAVQLVLTQGIDGGYLAFDTQVRWQDSVLNYLPATNPADEARWENCVYPLRFDDRTDLSSPPRPPQPSVHFGCVQGPRSDDEAFQFVPERSAGPILQFEFQCLADGTSMVELLPRDGELFGTYFLQSIQDIVDPTLTSATIVCGP